MTNAYGNHDQTPKDGAQPETPEHQREDQPLKELNEDTDDTENGTNDVDKRNAQGDHAGSAHDPAAFQPVDPAVADDGK
ncbi:MULTISPECIES: hypothetical protein [unclassified Yoonia]|uniref:hypothetical protein n=1 Tax=unclassified Yoonia TaxID=2629118 RepID=UPI002AFE91F1|nr:MULTISPECIES: hypothetical protein [unclassified Yoonia]